ncbi:hypothetical protein GCM10027275_54670 [Rhabdobacter roseus]
MDTIGLASVELAAPIRTSSRFRIASITKQFTAALVVKAVEDGKLHLDAPLSRFFPEAPAPWHSITLHQLLTHTAGIPHNEGIRDYWAVKSRLPLSASQAQAEIFGMPLLFPPGTGTHYSSPGYFLLATILEQIYQDSFANILDKHVLEPLDMRASGLYSSGRVVPLMTSGYHLAGDSLQVAPYRDMSLMKGSGDLYTSAADLVRWNAHLMEGTWTSPKVTERLFSVQNPGSVNGHTDPYGYGWYLRGASGVLPEARYTGGGTFGCSALSVMYPRTKTSLIILSNVSTLPVNQLWADLEKIMLELPFSMPELLEAQVPSQQDITQLPGAYQTTSGQVLRILTADGKLYAKLGGNPPFELFKSAELRFFGKKVSVTFTFQRNDEGTIASVSADGRGQNILFMRMEP